MDDTHQPDPTSGFPRMLPLTGKPAQIDRAYIELVGEPQRDLLAFAMTHALKLTRGNRADAEDLAQDAYVKLIGYTFTRPVNGRAFLTRVLTNRHIDLYRRRQTQKAVLGVNTGFEIALDDLSSDHVTRDVAEGVVFSTEIRVHIGVVIDSYPDAEQRPHLWALLDLDDGDLRPLEQVAAVTGLSLSKVKKLSSWLKTRLQAALAELAPNRPSTAPDAPTL